MCIRDRILTTQDNTRVVEKPLILNIIHQMGSVEDLSLIHILVALI